MAQLHDVAVGVPHVQSDTLSAGAEQLGRTAYDVEHPGVRDGLQVARLDDDLTWRPPG